MWLETKTVRPSAPSDRRSSRTSTMPAGSSPFAGSSRTSSAGSFSKRGGDAEALLHAERVGLRRGRRPARPVRPARATSSTVRRPMPSIAPEDLQVPPTRERGNSAGVSTIEPTRRIDPGSLDRDVGRRAGGACPPRRATRPSRQRIVVVLPAPFGPRKPKTPPSGTARSSPSTARVRPRAAVGTPCGAPRSRSRRPSARHPIPCAAAPPPHGCCDAVTAARGSRRRATIGSRCRPP